MFIRVFILVYIMVFFVLVFYEELLKVGLFGVGVNFLKGINVFVSIEIGMLERYIYVVFNGEFVKREEVEIIYYVVEKFVFKDFFGEVEVWQYFDFFNGYGFGNSVGGVFGMVLVLSYVFGGMWFRVVQFVYEVEVKYKGGFGDVIGQFVGGIEVRIKLGGFGIGVIDNLFFEDYKVFVVFLGRLFIREVFDGDVVKVIEVEGRKVFEEFLKELKLERMMVLVRNFVEKIGFFLGEFFEIVREFDKVLKNLSLMIMFGKGFFVFVRDEEVEKVKQLLSDMNFFYDIVEIYIERLKVGCWVGQFVIFLFFLLYFIWW